MEIRDLTGRHAVTVVGAAPKRVLTGGPDGLGYTEFGGAGCLELADPDGDFLNASAGPYCIEVVAWVFPPCDLFDGNSGSSDSSILDTVGGFYASDTALSLSGYRGHYSIYPGMQPWADTRLAGTWVRVRYDIRPGRRCDVYLNGQLALADRGAGTLVNSTGVLRIGGRVGFNGYYTKARLAGIRITRANRGAGLMDLGKTGVADPLWSQTLLNLSLAGVPRGDHDDLLRRLLPPVSMDRSGVNIIAETLAVGAALDAAQAGAGKLLAEADPRLSSMLLADWERNYGLEAGSASEASRRAALVAQILAGGGQSRAYYVAVAAALGYAATIEEFALHNVMSPVTFPLYGRAWRFVWRVRAHPGVGAVAAAAFEVLINKLKPAHTRVVFDYY